MAVSNTIATIPGFVVPIIVGIFTADDVRIGQCYIHMLRAASPRGRGVVL